MLGPVTITALGSKGLNEHMKGMFGVCGREKPILIIAWILDESHFHKMRLQSGSPVRVSKCVFSFLAEKEQAINSFD